MAMTKRSVAELNIGELECKNRCLAERKGFKARLVAQAPHYTPREKRFWPKKGNLRGQEPGPKRFSGGVELCENSVNDPELFCKIGR